MKPTGARKTPHLAWDKATIIAALHARREQGLDLYYWAVCNSDRSLSDAIRRYFGSFDEALRCAGVDPAATRRRVVWDKDAIVTALRARRASGLDMNIYAIQKSQAALAGAIFRHFRFHDRALLAAGIDPVTARHAGHWDKSKVVAELRRRHATGEALSHSALAKQNSRLLAATNRLFGSHSAGLCAAGIDADSAKAVWPVVWPTERILVGIRDFYPRWWAVHPKTQPPKPRLTGADRPLSIAALSRFGNLAAALKAAGIDDPTYRSPRRWTKDDILAALRDAAKDGTLSNKMALAADARVPMVAARYFGSLRAAAEAAGLQYVNTPRSPRLDIGHWTEQTSLQTLRDLHRDGHDLRYRHMKQHSQPLFFAAKHLFGSYVNAVRQAGINYWEMSQAQVAKDRAAAAAKNAARGEGAPIVSDATMDDHL